MTIRVLSTLAALSLLAACSTSDGPTDTGSSTGTLHAPLVFPGPDHEVTSISYVVVGAGEACDAEPIATASAPIEDETLPIHLEGDPPGGDNHPFGDALFVLAPGDYHICATPTLADGTASEDCPTVEGDATVVAEQTTEILLISQCMGDPTGALDVIVALNDPPQIDDLLLEESKFAEACQPVALTVVASDPNGDALSYDWSVASSPDGGASSLVGAGSTATFQGFGPGAYTLLVVVDDGHGATAQLAFPIHVSGSCDGDCCAAGSSVGCEEATCTAAVCAIDSFCCEVEWDGLCADEAADLCEQCMPQGSSCCVVQDTPGCDDLACEDAVCTADPFCCDTQWDDLCVNGGELGGPGSVALCPDLCGGNEPPGGQCPAEADINGPCVDEGLACSFGEECCCGECFPSLECVCGGGQWNCFFTDACFIPPCEEP